MNIHLQIQPYRRKLLIGGPLLLLFIILIMYMAGGRYVSTDDAYIKAANAAISTNVPGQVAAIYVKDNQKVKKGERLFNLDDRPYKIAVDNAKAVLASARLQVQALKASYRQRQAEVEAAQNTLTYERVEYERQKKLAASGISSQMQLNKATNVFNNAEQQLAAAKHQLASVLAQLSGNPDIPIDQHPLVQKAETDLEHAKLNLSYTVVTAPIDGIVTKVEQLQNGDYIRPGTPVFSLISDKDIWIEANFKETQLTNMRPGQKVTIEIDAYPGKKFSGHVESTSPGTGAVFSLLPPENATGNWVKIVQRLPVRITIDNPDPALFLHSGLSVTVTVDTEHHRLWS